MSRGRVLYEKCSPLITNFHRILVRPMQRAIARLLVAVCACAAGATHAQGMDIDGQVFIVTRGGPAIKLALVRVAAFRKVDIETHVRDIDSRLAGERAKADAEVSEASQSLQRAKRMSLVDSANG